MRENPNRPIKEKARGFVRVALRQGVIRMSDKCENCGAPNTPCADGRRSLQAHHHDYSKPLEVKWLCAKCHRAVTPVPIGVRNGAAKLNPSQIEQMEARYRNGETFKGIARDFGVHRRTVARAVKGEHWLAARNLNTIKGE
jgi:hypothetical protein